MLCLVFLPRLASKINCDNDHFISLLSLTANYFTTILIVFCTLPALIWRIYTPDATKLGPRAWEKSPTAFSARCSGVEHAYRVPLRIINGPFPIPLRKVEKQLDWKPWSKHFPRVRLWYLLVLNNWFCFLPHVLLWTYRWDISLWVGQGERGSAHNIRVAMKHDSLG